MVTLGQVDRLIYLFQEKKEKKFKSQIFWFRDVVKKLKKNALSLNKISTYNTDK